MEEPVGTQIFWMITIGLVLGYVSYFIHRESALAVNLVPSILIGLAGALVAGMAAFLFDLNLPEAYSVIGAIGFLFLVNAFRQKDDWKTNLKS